jgi:hypothetical protein
MASTYSSLKFELIGTGDQSGTWGVTTNTNLGTAIEEAITGSADVSFASADVTLTLTDTNSAQTARNLRLNLIGTSGGARNLTVPNIEKFYIVTNGLADTVTVKNTTGTTITIPSGRTTQVFSTGTGVIFGADYFSGAVLSSAAVLLGGSINGTAIGNITPSTGAFTTLTATTPTTGDNSTKAATTAFVQSTVGTLGTMSQQNANSVAITGGTITGATVNASNITNTSGWSVTPTGTTLYFNYNGTNVAKLDSLGNLTVKANVTAYGTV